MEWNKERVKKFLETENGVVEVITTMRFLEPNVEGIMERIIPDTAYQRTLLTNSMLKNAKEMYDPIKWQFQEIGFQFYKIFKDLEETHKESG